MSTTHKIGSIYPVKVIREEFSRNLDPSGPEYLVFSQLDLASVMKSALYFYLNSSLDSRLNVEWSRNAIRTDAREQALVILAAARRKNIIPIITMDIKYIEEVIEDIIRAIPTIDVISSFLHNEVRPLMAFGPYEQFAVDKTNHCFLITSLGDFRILEWESEHLKTGRYV